MSELLPQETGHRCPGCGEPCGPPVNIWGADVYGCAKCCPNVGGYSGRIVLKMNPESGKVRVSTNGREFDLPKPTVRFADLDKGDQLQILKDCNERAIAEVSAHFDKTYGEQIEAYARENERLRAELGDRAARSAILRDLQSEARRKEREQVVLDTSMWDD